MSEKKIQGSNETPLWDRMYCQFHHRGRNWIYGRNILSAGFSSLPLAVIFIGACTKIRVNNQAQKLHWSEKQK